MVSVGFKDTLRFRWALLCCIIQPLTLLHRLFVVAQFVFVAFQCLMFVLLTPLSCHRVWSVDPDGLSACGAWRGTHCEFSSFFPAHVGDIMLIGLVALPVYSPLRQLAPVRSMLYIRLQASLTHIQASPPSNPPWEVPVNSICQLFIILMANTFLAFRSVYIQVWSIRSHKRMLTELFSIYGLTKSRLQCCSVIVLSAIAFALGMATNSNVIAPNVQSYGYFHAKASRLF